ncbi:MAG: SH3 domain-containing protein [Clostridia bacterium]|nr:SH3 domain-containing protein [Clostridia bacterium]
MKKKLAAALLLAVLLCGLAMAGALAATYGTVVGGWLRLRANPSYDAAVITSYRTGSVVTILSQSGGWARVMTSDYRLGYMDQRYLYIDGGSAPPTSSPTASPVAWTTVNRNAWVTSENGKGVRMRNAPVVNKYNVMGLYPVGRTVLELKVSNNGWSYIQIDGKYGYMMSRYLTTGYSPWPGPTTVPLTLPPHITAMPGPGVTATPTPPPIITPEPDVLKGVALNILSPHEGDTLKLAVTPSNIKYSAIWYRADNRVLLSTGNSFTVTASEVGTAITVRVTAEDGTVAEVSTNPVQPLFSSSSKSVKTIESSLKSSAEWLDSGYTAASEGVGDGGLAEATGGITRELADVSAPADPPASESNSQSSGVSELSGWDDLPDFVKRTIGQDGGAVYAEPVP